MSYQLSPNPCATIIRTVNEEVLPQCVLDFGEFICGNFEYDYEALEDDEELWEDDDELLGLADVIFTDDDDAVYTGAHIYNNQYKQYCELVLDQTLAYKFFSNQNRRRRFSEARKAP